MKLECTANYLKLELNDSDADRAVDGQISSTGNRSYPSLYMIITTHFTSTDKNKFCSARKCCKPQSPNNKDDKLCTKLTTHPHAQNASQGKKRLGHEEQMIYRDSYTKTTSGSVVRQQESQANQSEDMQVQRYCL